MLPKLSTRSIRIIAGIYNLLIGKNKQNGTIVRKNLIGALFWFMENKVTEFKLVSTSAQIHLKIIKALILFLMNVTNKAWVKNW